MAGLTSAPEAPGALVDMARGEAKAGEGAIGREWGGVVRVQAQRSAWCCECRVELRASSASLWLCLMRSRVLVERATLIGVRLVLSRLAISHACSQCEGPSELSDGTRVATTSFCSGVPLHAFVTAVSPPTSCPHRHRPLRHLRSQR